MSAPSNGEVQVQRGTRVRADPVVSVIIPVWRSNASKRCWLDEALDSVRAQTFDRWEIIIVDDGSPVPVDPVDDVVLVRKPHAGPGAARNLGVSLARGRLIAFLDADDIYRPRKLELQVALHERRPELVLSSTGYIHFDEQGPRPPLRRRELGAEITFEQLFFENCIACSSTMMPRSTYDRTRGMAPDRRLGEDYGLWLRIAMLGRIGYIDEVLLEHRVHPDSLGQQHRRAGTAMTREREVYDEFLAEYPELQNASFVSSALARLEHQDGWNSLRSRDWTQARRSLFRSLRLDPRRPRVWIDVARTFLRL